MLKKNEDEEKQLKREEVLSCDIATHTGYYSVYGAGTWDFSTKKNKPEQHLLFYNTLKNFITDHHIKQIVAEDVNVGGGGKSFLGERLLS